MRALWLQLVLGLVLSGLIAGCGGNPSAPSPPAPVTITATFAGATPASAAVQVGSGSFTPTTIQGNQISVTVPAGTTRYAIAYVCPRVAAGLTINAEFVIQATVQDGMSLTPPCLGTGPPTGSATVAVDATAIPGATGIMIVGNHGVAQTLNSTSVAIAFGLPPGMNDVAIIALDASSDTLAVRILRSQTVPGAINGGNTVVLNSSDLTTNQPFMVNNVPPFFSTPSPLVTYHTAGGTPFQLKANPPAEYATVPAGTASSGDFYDFETISSEPSATHTSEVSVGQTSSGGGPVTLTLPPAWSASDPTPSALPTLTFNYSGFSGSPAIAEIAEIDWTNSTITTSNDIRVTATSSFQNGATTITIPDLSSLPGFPSPAPSGATIHWFATIFDSTKVVPFVASAPMNVSVGFVANFGSYTVP